MTTMPVVAAVDGSEESLRAVEWAALEAQRHRAPLRIVSGARPCLSGRTWCTTTPPMCWPATPPAPTSS